MVDAQWIANIGGVEQLVKPPNGVLKRTRFRKNEKADEFSYKRKQKGGLFFFTLTGLLRMRPHCLYTFSFSCLAEKVNSRDKVHIKFSTNGHQHDLQIKKKIQEVEDETFIEVQVVNICGTLLKIRHLEFVVTPFRYEDNPSMTQMTSSENASDDQLAGVKRSPQRYSEPTEEMTLEGTRHRSKRFQKELEREEHDIVIARADFNLY